MASLALPAADLFSVVTTTDRGARSPAWQSLLNWPKFGDAHVAYAAETAAQRNIWAARMDEAVMRADRPVLLVASGESCFAAAWWARLSPAAYVSRVAGALLFAPLKRNGAAEAKFASPAVALPFPSAIVNGAVPGDQRRLLALAESWGSGFLESDWDAAVLANESAWHPAHRALMRLSAKLIERKMRAAEALGVRT